MFAPRMAYDTAGGRPRWDTRLPYAGTDTGLEFVEDDTGNLYVRKRPRIRSPPRPYGQGEPNQYSPPSFPEEQEDDEESDTKAVIEPVANLPEGTTTEVLRTFVRGQPVGKPKLIIDITGPNDAIIEQENEDASVRTRGNRPTPFLFRERPALVREIMQQAAAEEARQRDQERRLTEWRRSAAGRQHQAQTCSFCKRPALVEFVDGVSMCINHYMELARDASRNIVAAPPDEPLFEALGDVVVSGYQRFDTAAHTVLDDAGMGQHDMLTDFARTVLPIEPGADVDELYSGGGRGGIRPLLPQDLHDKLLDKEEEESEENAGELAVADWAYDPCCLTDLAQDYHDVETSELDMHDQCPHPSIVRLSKNGNVTMCAYHFALCLMLQVEAARRSLFLRIEPEATRLYLKWAADTVAFKP